MLNSSSPIVDFYPEDFEVDLNGKQQEWEAVVLIPFIEEERLISAMKSKEHKLTASENARNTHGPCLIYKCVFFIDSDLESSLTMSYGSGLNNHFI